MMIEFILTTLFGLAIISIPAGFFWYTRNKIDWLEVIGWAVILFIAIVVGWTVGSWILILTGVIPWPEHLRN